MPAIVFSFEQPFEELDFLPKRFKTAELPEQRPASRGIPAHKKETIIEKLVPLMPVSRRAFWAQLETNNQSIDLQTGGELLEEN